MASVDTHTLPPAPQQQAQYHQDQIYDQYSQQEHHQQNHLPPQQQYQQPALQQQQISQQQDYYSQQPVPQPQPVQQAQAQPQVPKHRASKSRTFSFHSDKSQKSAGSKKIDYHETHREKEAKRLHSKADPTLAMNEAEPSAVQANHQTSLTPLRSIQHKDPFGNLIADPDRSNPTRSRWERPLDTIRNFEAAIDGGSRKSYVRPDVDPISNWNRRNSYYNNAGGVNGNGQRHPGDSNYGSRPPSQFDMRQAHRDSYYEGQSPNYAHNGYGYPTGANRSRTRLHPDAYAHQGPRGEQGVYPLQHKDRSYETVTSAGTSGSSGDHNSYHTDPSSDNGSVDRPSPAKRSPVTNDYGIGSNQPTSYQPSSFKVGQNPNGPALNNQPLQNGYGSGPTPPVPQKDQTMLSKVPTNMQKPVTQQDKRKSWFARRFSKA